MTAKHIIALVLSTALLASCAHHGRHHSGINKADVGTLAGAIGGALAAGNNLGKGKGKTLAIAGGTLLGAWLGNEIGASMDRADALYYSRVSQSSLERNRIGQTSTWVNPDSGNQGTITPIKTYQESGRYCREFNQTITVGGQTQDGYGKACRMPDGSWQIES